MEAYKLLINGEYLDLSEDFKLSLQNKNPLFAYADVEAARSASFSIPATAKNNRIFNLANLPEMYGGQARLNISCTLQYSGGIMACKLHITDADRSSYKCVLIFGDMMPFLALKNAGKVADVLARSNVYPYVFDYEKTGAGESDVVPMGEFLAVSGYRHNKSGISRLPSYNMGYLCWMMCEQISGISFPAPAEEYANVWLLPKFTDNGTSDGLVFPHRGNHSGYPALSYRVKMAEQMPDWSCVEMLLNYAHYAGLLPFADKDGKVCFDDGTMTDWKTKTLNNIMTIGEVRRDFNEWAQYNEITFKDTYEPTDLAGYPPAATHGTRYYFINNKNIDKEKTLHEFAASNGRAWSDNDSTLNIVDAGETIGIDTAGDIVTEIIYDGCIICTKESGYLHLANPRANALITTLCTASTSIKVQSRMTFAEYMQLAPQTLFNIYGKLYVWTSAKWSAGVCDFRMSLYQ